MRRSPLARVSGVCAYCLKKRATNRDHVVPRSIAKRYNLPEALKATVPACFDCNNRKGTRKLIPASWACHIPALQEVIPGAWRVWDGDPQSDAFRAVHR